MLAILAIIPTWIGTSTAASANGMGVNPAAMADAVAVVTARPAA